MDATEGTVTAEGIFDGTEGVFAFFADGLESASRSIDGLDEAASVMSLGVFSRIPSLINKVYHL